MRSNVKSIISSICAFLVVILLLVVIVPKAESMKVSELSWTRSVEIEEYKAVRESGWTLPLGGWILYTNQEVKSFIQVLDHYDTQVITSGESTIGEKPVLKKVPVYRKDPVYATKYYYTIDRWVYSRTETASGMNDEPYWPEFSLSEREREKSRTQKYTIKLYSTLDRKKVEKSYTISYDLWQQLNLNDEITITVLNGKITNFKRR